VRLEEKGLPGLMPLGLFANVAGQVAGGIDRRVDENGPAAALLGQPGGIKPAQGGSHDGQGLAGPISGAFVNESGGLGG